MEKDWMKIFVSEELYRAEVVKGLLEEEGITAVVLNKKDPVTKVIGEAEVYVNKDDAMKAVNLIKNAFDA